MTEEKLSLWDWVLQKWSSPRWKRGARLLAAAALAVLGGISLATAPGSGNWILLFAAAVIFLVVGLRIEVPEEPLPLAPDLREEANEAKIPEAIPPAAAKESRVGLQRKATGALAFLRLPLAAVAAFCGQWVSDTRPFQPIVTSQHAGWILFGLAFLLLGWALVAGDVAFALEATYGGGTRPALDLRRAVFFACALVFGLLAYTGFGGGMFRVLPLVLLALAAGYWWIALADYSGGFGEKVLDAPPRAVSRIRAAGDSLRKGVALSPWSLLVLLCFGALVVYRTYNLASIPPEMTSDHIEKLSNVVDILEGRAYIFFANNGGREPLEFYLIAAVSQLLGTGISFLSLKIVSIAVGIATLPFLYLLGKELADRRVGLLAMILGGVGYWPDMISRIGLRLPLAMLFSAATLYFFLKALRRRRWNDFLWAGMALGVGMYGYTPIRIVPVALVIIVVLFLIHPSAKGSRRWALIGFLATIATAILLFIPFLRYAVDFPGDFWLRTITRIVPSEGPVVNPIGTFFYNIGNALLMFSWNDGVGWFNCVPLRPALDIVTGGLFHLGVFGMIVYAIRKRSWEAAALVLIIPVLLLPSILALAIPNENPSLARALAAEPVVFLLPAFAVILLVDYVKGLIPGGDGRLVAALITAVMVILAAGQDFDLTQNQYPMVYRQNSQNELEIGAFMRGFTLSIGRPDDAYFIPYPYWIDDRIMNVYAGFPIHSVHYVFPADLPAFAFSGRPTLFLLLAVDQDDLRALREKFPDGYYGTVVSSYPGHDYVFFLVPGTPSTANP